jgi:hypothetical protein
MLACAHSFTAMRLSIGGWRTFFRPVRFEEGEIAEEEGEASRKWSMK